MSNIGNEKYKKMIEDIFDNLDTSKYKFKPIKKDVEETNSDTAKFCKEMALEEFERIRELFIEFQENINEYAVSEYLVPAIQSFANFAAALVSVVENEDIKQLDSNILDSSTAEKMQQLKKLRAQIFSSVYNKYKKKND